MNSTNVNNTFGSPPTISYQAVLESLRDTPRSIYKSPGVLIKEKNSPIQAINQVRRVQIIDKGNPTQRVVFTSKDSKVSSEKDVKYLAGIASSMFEDDEDGNNNRNEVEKILFVKEVVNEKANPVEQDIDDAKFDTTTSDILMGSIERLNTMLINETSNHENSLQDDEITLDKRNIDVKIIPNSDHIINNYDNIPRTLSFDRSVDKYNDHKDTLHTNTKSNTNDAYSKLVSPTITKELQSDIWQSHLRFLRDLDREFNQSIQNTTNNSMSSELGGNINKYEDPMRLLEKYLLLPVEPLQNQVFEQHRELVQRGIVTVEEAQAIITQIDTNMSSSNRYNPYY